MGVVGRTPAARMRASSRSARWKSCWGGGVAQAAAGAKRDEGHAQQGGTQDGRQMDARPLRGTQAVLCGQARLAKAFELAPLLLLRLSAHRGQPALSQGYPKTISPKTCRPCLEFLIRSAKAALCSTRLG